MAKFVFGLMMLVSPIFAFRAVEKNKVSAGPLVKAMIVISAGGCFAFGLWFIQESALNEITWRSQSLIEQQTPDPFVIQITTDEELEQCQLRLADTRGQMDVLQNQVNVCGFRLTEQSIQFHNVRDALFECEALRQP